MHSLLRSAIRGMTLIAVLLQLHGCALLYQYEAISEKPPLEGSQTPLEPRLSTIQPSLAAPIKLLEDAANIATDKVLPIANSDQNTIASADIHLPWWLGGGCILCASLDVNWHYNAFKPKPIAISGANNRLVVDLAARVDGGAGFGGDIAKLLSLSDKSFGAGADVKVSSGLGADLNYCPTLISPGLDYRWDPEPYFQVIGRTCMLGGNFCFGPWNLEFGAQIDARIRPQLANIAATLQQNVPCQPIRSQLANVWRQYSLPVKVPYEELYLNIVPEALYFPGLGVTSSDIVFAGRLDAKVSLDAAPGSNAPLPLPQNKPLPISPGRFSLAVPISTQYYTFDALAKQALDQKKLSAHTPLGDVRVTPTKVELFPTAGGAELALGVSVAVEFQYLFFLNTSGTVWLTAKPESLDSGRRIRLSDINVTRKFSNPIWNIASLALESKIAEAIRDGFELDLGPSLIKAENDITSMINSAGQGGVVTLSAKDVKIALGRMLAAEKAFQLEVIFDAAVEANIEKVAMP